MAHADDHLSPALSPSQVAIHSKQLESESEEPEKLVEATGQPPSRLTPARARVKLNPAQVEFVDRLLDMLELSTDHRSV